MRWGMESQRQAGAHEGEKEKEAQEMAPDFGGRVTKCP